MIEFFVNLQKKNRAKEFKIDAELYATNQNMRSVFFSEKNGLLNR